MSRQNHNQAQRDAMQRCLRVSSGALYATDGMAFVSEALAALDGDRLKELTNAVRAAHATERYEAVGKLLVEVVTDYVRSTPLYEDRVSAELSEQVAA